MVPLLMGVKNIYDPDTAKTIIDSKVQGGTQIGNTTIFPEGGRARG